MIEFVGRYENRKHHFYLKIENGTEFAFIQPYFLVTTMDHPRKGRINRMECLFSGSIWEGTHSHGYGYSCSADVYGTLIEIIEKLYKSKLSEEAKQELYNINTHNERLNLSDKLLAELEILNAETFQKKFA